MNTVRIRERRISLRSREAALLLGTLACSALFLVTQNQVGLLGYAIAPFLLLAFFVLQADLVWRGHKTPGSAFAISGAAWLAFSALAASSRTNTGFLGHLAKGACGSRLPCCPFLFVGADR